MEKKKRTRTKAEREANGRRTGRPPKPKSQKRSAHFQVNVTLAEAKALRAEAKRLGTSVSALFLEAWRQSRGR